MLLSEKVQYILTFCSLAVSWSVPQHHCAAWLRPTGGDQTEICTLLITRLYLPFYLFINNLLTNAKNVKNFLSSFTVEVINRCIQDVLNSPLFCISNFHKTNVMKYWRTLPQRKWWKMRYIYRCLKLLHIKMIYEAIHKESNRGNRSMLMTSREWNRCLKIKVNKYALKKVCSMCTCVVGRRQEIIAACCCFHIDVSSLCWEISQEL